MNAEALQADVKKALLFVAKKHGIAVDTQMIGKTDTSLRFTVTLGEQLTQDMREYLALVTPEMKRGHESMKHRIPGLCDEMLGKRFRIHGSYYVYMGYIHKRPSYPVSMLMVKGNSYSQRKCAATFLTEAVAEYQRVYGKEREKQIQQQLRRVNPELAAEASF